MTNDFCISELAEEILPNARILFLGGVVRRGYRYTNGPEVLWGMERYRTDKAFLSTNGYTPEEGFTSEDPDQAQVKRAYVRQARMRYVLADESKLGVVSFVKFADICEVDTIITSSTPSPEALEGLRAKNENIQILAR